MNCHFPKNRTSKCLSIIPVTHLEHPGFKSWPQDQLRFVVLFVSPFTLTPGYYLKLGQNHFFAFVTFRYSQIIAALDAILAQRH